MGMSAAVMGGRFIYLFGGYEAGPLNTIEQYDITERQTWTVITCRLKWAFWDLSSILIAKNKILVFGGKNRTGEGTS